MRWWRKHVHFQKWRELILTENSFRVKAFKVAIVPRHAKQQVEVASALPLFRSAREILHSGPE